MTVNNKSTNKVTKRVTILGPMSISILYLYIYLSIYPHPSTCLLILERRAGRGKRERSIYVRNIDRLPLVYSLTGNQTLHLGMYPDQGCNRQPFGVQDDTQLTVPPGQGYIYTIYLYTICLNYHIL